MGAVIVALDPVFVIILRLGLSALFMVSAANKSKNFSAFLAALADYRILPQALQTVSAVILLATEWLTAIALLHFGWAWPPALAAVLLLLYATAISVNLLRGRNHIDCGCYGPAHRTVTLSWLLVIRNTVLAAAAALSVFMVFERQLHWLDMFTITLGVLVLGLLYQSVELALGHYQRAVSYMNKPGMQ